MKAKYSCVVFLMIALVGISLRTLEAQTSQPLSPKQVVSRLLNTRHGLRNLAPEETVLLDEMRNNPGLYAPAIREAVTLPTRIADLPPYYELRKVGGALALARELGLEHGGPIARQVFLESHRLLQEYRKRGSSSPPHVKNKTKRYIEGLTGSALKVLGRLGDDTLVPTVVGVLGTDDKLLEPSILEFLERVAPLRPDIRPKLEEMYNSPDSPLRNNPQLLRVLKAMEKAGAERRIERPAKSKRESKGKDDE